MTPELRNRFTNRDRDASAQEENRNTETPQEPKAKYVVAYCPMIIFF